MTHAFLLRADLVITIGSAGVIRDGEVRASDGRIAGVGGRGQLETQADDLVLELGARTILPGLIDCHEHLSGHDRFAIGDSSVVEPDAMFALVGTFHARRLLSEGITTARVPGAPGHVDLHLRRAIELGYVEGPRLVCAGQHLAMTGGHGSVSGLEVDGPERCMQGAREQLKAGADFIKVVASGGVGITRPGERPVQPELTEAEMAAIVGVAHAAGKRVTAHADGEDGIQHALDAGVDCIEHGIYLTPQQATQMADTGVALVPTLSTMRGIAARGAEWGMPQEWIPIAESVLDPHLSSFQHALRAGVTFAAGTDGFGELVSELEIFEECGVTPLDAIRAATLSGAEIIGADADYGRLQPGASADLIAVDGDPVQDLSVLRRISLVMAGGIVRRDPEHRLSTATAPR